MITIQEVLKKAIDQIEHLQEMITDLESDMLTNSGPSPRLRSTTETISLLEEAIKRIESPEIGQGDELVIGQRYWLDPIMDVSGVYVGYNRHSYNFGEIKGNDVYDKNTDGTVSFGIPKNFILIPQTNNK